MNKRSTILFLCLTFLSTISLHAQETKPEMADLMRSEGKIYVVVGILLIIFIGLITYLVMLDKKISRLEKRLPEKKG